MNTTYTVFHLDHVGPADVDFETIRDVRGGLLSGDKLHETVRRIARPRGADQRGLYIRVARVERDGLEQVFHATNHINREWWRNAGVVKLTEQPAASTSVGDLVRDESTGEIFIVARTGFERIEGVKL